MEKQHGDDYPFISVVVPVYNEQEKITGCLQSIRNQHYPHDKVETIVIDDGSTDESASTARECGAKVFQQEHTSPGAARNRGVQEASASIIAFIDADDRASESWLREAVAYLNEDKAAAVGCNHDLLNKKSDLVKIAWLERNFRLSRSREKVDHLGTSGCLYKKNSFESAGGFDRSLLAAEDMDLSNRVRKQGGILYLVKRPLINVEYPSSWLRYFHDQIRKVAYLLLFRWKSRGTKKGLGDSYSGLRDYMQSLLPYAFLLCLLFLMPSYSLAIASMVLLFVLLGLNAPFTFFVFRNRKRIELSLLWPAVLFVYLIARALSWSAGLIYGVQLVLRKA